MKGGNFFFGHRVPRQSLESKHICCTHKSTNGFWGQNCTVFEVKMPLCLSPNFDLLCKSIYKILSTFIHSFVHSFIYSDSAQTSLVNCLFIHSFIHLFKNVTMWLLRPNVWEHKGQDKATVFTQVTRSWQKRGSQQPPQPRG